MFHIEKHVDPIPFPKTPVIKNPAYQEQEECFDERIHLDIQLPNYVVDLNFQMVPFPYCNKNKNSFTISIKRLDRNIGWGQNLLINYTIVNNSI